MPEDNELVKCDEKIFADEESVSVKKDKLNDIIITQCIICLVIAVGMVILNIFYPELCRELIEKYKYYSGQSESNKVNEVIKYAVEIIGNISE